MKLKAIPPMDAKEIVMKRIDDLTQQYFSLPIKKIKSKERTRELVIARQMAMVYLHKKFSGHPVRLSLKDIANHFCKKDHTTVIHARQTMEDLCFTDRDIKATLEGFFNYCDNLITNAA